MQSSYLSFIATADVVCSTLNLLTIANNSGGVTHRTTYDIEMKEIDGNAMVVVLCAETSASYGVLVADMASKMGVGSVICHDARQVLDYLASPQVYMLMIVTDQANANETGVNLIRSTRMLASRVTMPILFVMTDRDFDLALRAMQAGATEIALRSDIEQVDSLIYELSNTPWGAALTGRVLLVEDSERQALYVENLCITLGLNVDRCASVQEGIEYLQKADYQVAIIDIVLRGLSSGLALVRHIRQLPPPHSRMPILVMSGFDDVARRVELLRIGADDFLAKPFAEDEFVCRLQRILQARSSGDSEASSIQPADIQTWQQRGLSLRESEICRAMIQGQSDKQIASDFEISFWTVRSHVTSIFVKLGVINRRELMARYLPSMGR